MMLSSCVDNKHNVKFVISDDGYTEECLTCNMRVHTKKPKSPYAREIYDKMLLEVKKRRGLQ